MNELSKIGRLLAALLIIVVAPFADAQTEQQANSTKATKAKRPTSYWPEQIEFSTEITTPVEYLNFRIGQRHLDHAQLVGYLKLIASQSDRMQLQQYGETHGGRPLLLLTISSPENLKNVNKIRRQHRMLADPEKSADVLMDDLPAVINMGYGVHGDEASATNCAALVAHYLAAAQGEEIENWLDQCVILFDPSLNPDGFNRFANWVNDHRGRVPNADKNHREHNQPWPAGRVNYYWFDLNRDWLPLEQPESQARMRWYHAWKPNVVLDFHEMGTDSTYFFQPGVPKRTNPLTPIKNLELTARFGQYHADALDARGSLFFTKELFDDFYMGKGSTYPDLHGAVGILFEQASARGHVQENQDGQLRFHDAIANHFSTSLSSLRATSDMRTDLLEHKKTFYEEAITQATKSDVSAYVFTCENNPARLERFAQTLLRHDIRCYRPSDSDSNSEDAAAQDSLLVPLNQPEYRFLQSLLMRRKNFEENIFYDVSTWTLSLAYGLEQSELKGSLELDSLELVTANRKKANRFSPDDAAVAYAVDWRSDNAVALLGELLNREINVRVATHPFSVSNKDGDGEKQFERGTLLIPLGVQPNRRKQIERMLARAAKKHVTSYPIYSGLSLQGSDLGSNRMKKLSKPNVLMAVGRGASQYGAGEIWHLLDVNHGVQVTMADDIGKVDLEAYSTLVFPPGRHGGLDQKEWNSVAARIKRGATAIAVGSSCNTIQAKLNKVLAVPEKEKADAAKDGATKEQAKEKDSASPTNHQLPFDSASKTQALQLISGAIFQTVIDRTHPLFYGFPNDKLPVFRNHAQFLEPSKNPYCNPGIYDASEPHLAGYCSPENLEKISKSASVVVTPIGKGRLIQISDSPNFRAFWHGTSRVFMNSLFFGEFINPPKPRNEE